MYRYCVLIIDQLEGSRSDVIIYTSKVSSNRSYCLLSTALNNVNVVYMFIFTCQRYARSTLYALINVNIAFNLLVMVLCHCFQMALIRPSCQATVGAIGSYRLINMKTTVIT